MPTPMDAMLSLVIVAIGFLMLVVSFSVNDTKKRLVSYVLVLFVVAIGFGYFIKAETRSLRVRKRISNIQNRSRANLDDIQKRLKKTTPGREKTPGQ